VVVLLSVPFQLSHHNEASSYHCRLCFTCDSGNQSIVLSLILIQLSLQRCSGQQDAKAQLSSAEKVEKDVRKCGESFTKTLSPSFNPFLANLTAAVSGSKGSMIESIKLVQSGITKSSTAFAAKMRRDKTKEAAKFDRKILTDFIKNVTAALSNQAKAASERYSSRKLRTSAETFYERLANESLKFVEPFIEDLQSFYKTKPSKIECWLSRKDDLSKTFANAGTAVAAIIGSIMPDWKGRIEQVKNYNVAIQQRIESVYNDCKNDTEIQTCISQNVIEKLLL